MSEALLLTAGPRSTHNNGKTFEELEAEGKTCAFFVLFVVAKKKLSDHAIRIPGRILDKYCVPAPSRKNGHPAVKMRPGCYPREVIEALTTSEKV